jgi:hypothetical protein
MLSVAPVFIVAAVVAVDVVNNQTLDECNFSSFPF